MGRPPKIENLNQGKIALVYQDEIFEYWEQYQTKEQRRQIMVNWIMKYHLFCRHDLCHFYFLVKPG